MSEIEEIVKKLAADKTLMARFERNPASVIEEYVGVDLPDELIEKIIDGVKASITIEDAKDLLGSLKKLF